jgi:hypothetical protein
LKEICRSPSLQTEESGANLQEIGLACRQKSSDIPAGRLPKLRKKPKNSAKKAKNRSNLGVFAYNFAPLTYVLSVGLRCLERMVPFEEDGTMRGRERDLARRKLDKELKFYRWAAREKNPTPGLLRAVRHALGVPAAEMLKKLGVSPSVLFRLEHSERRGTISLKGLGRVAQAMGCMAVYAIIPRNGKTLEDLAEDRAWKKS